MPSVIRRSSRHLLLFVLLLSPGFALGQAAGSAKTAEAGQPQQEADNPAARQAWFLRGRVVLGKNAAELLQRAFQQKMAIRKAQQKAALQRAAAAPAGGGTNATGTVGTASVPVIGPPWSNIGPAPITGMPSRYGDASGRITALVVDPNDATSNIVYAAGAYGGVWRTTNGTASPGTVQWAPLFDTDPAASTLSIGAVAVQPGNSNVILVGTGEPDNAIDSYYGQGILRSTDGGTTWSLISSAISGQSFKGLGFSRIAFSTANSSLVVAGGAQTPLGIETGAVPGGCPTCGIYYSTDAGATWHLASTTDPGPTPIQYWRVTDVVYDAVVQKFFAVIAFHGFYSSADGINWTRVADPGSSINTTNCPSSPTNTSCGLYRGNLAVQPSSGDLYAVFIATSTTATPQIFRANFTSGQVTSWTQITITTGISACGDGNGCGTGTQGFYDLYVAAVPNGGSTDLYFGAVNLFKCNVNGANPTCGNTNSWLNLTHVYGSCASTYHSMHPDNHALAFHPANPGILYFGTDGGVYRSLNGFGLNIGSCGSTPGNTFDDLNTSSLGSLTQFIAISTHPTDGSITLGGTQDNGSPAIAGGQTSPPLNPPLWFEAEGGDGGFNHIDGSGANWYTAMTDVSIRLCSSGTACIETATFSQIVGNSQVGGDHGAFYTPYILDPADNSKIIVGTCRVWRGPNSSAGWPASALSPNFQGGAGACTGNEANTVHGLAAGGTPSGGVSPVIYAGTDGGHIWVTTNSTTWTDTTFHGPGSTSIDPGGFPIPGVAIDMAGDPNGNAAYITVMGFTGGAGHVWKTINAGGAWTDITGNLPDAPVNSVVVDPDNHNIIYVGTDVGVFVTTNPVGGATWSEWGSGLPNVAVVSLAATTDGHLRAGTHGRGVFDIQLASAIPYSLAVSDTPKTVYLGNLPAVFHGAAMSNGSFSSPVDLTCAGTTVPTTCTPAPTPLTPTTGAGTALTVTTSGAIGDYSFNLHGVGQDASHTVENAALTLHIVDFTVGAAPNPISIPHDQSGTVTVTVAAQGTLTDTVHLSCRAPLPTGISCGFSQNDFVPSNAGTGVTLTIATTTAAAVGSTVIHVDAAGSSAGAPTHTQDVTVDVTSNPDFFFTAASLTPAQVRVNQDASGSVSLGTQDGFASAVTLGCSVLPAGPSCSAFVPAAPTPPASATFTVSVGTGTPQNYVVTVTGNSTSPVQSHSVTIAYAIWDYSLLAPGSASAVPGASNNVPFKLHPLNGQQNVDVSCSTNITGGTCAIVGGTNPISLAGGDVSLTAALTIPAGPNPCGSGAGCTMTIHTVDHDVPTAPARDAVVHVFPPVTASNDFNADGRADILWQNSATGDVVVWLMNGATRLTGAVVVTGVDPNWKCVGVGDFNGDGKADILWQNSATGGVVVWLMDGASKTSSAFVAQGVDPNWKIVGVGDFDGDGKSDILWRNSATGSVVVWVMDGASRTSSAFVAQNVDPSWQIVGVGDFDGDSKADILWRNTSTGDLAIWLMNGAAKVSGVVVASGVDLNLQVAGVGDFDAHGGADILWRNKATGDVVLWLMNGTSKVSSSVVVSAVDPSWQVSGISDFDGDGKADILWNNSTTGDVVVWVMSGATKTSSGVVASAIDLNWKVVPFTHQ